MTQALLTPSRRGFLGGALALLAAPAIVRASSLMPVKVLDTWGPGGLLTVEMITKEFQRLLASRAKRTVSPYLSIRGLKQSYIQMNHDFRLRTLSLEQYSKRLLEPAAGNILRSVGDGVFGTDSLDIPQGVYEAARTNKGIGVRAVSDYVITSDSIITRFDVTHN